jgi:hypothetical protein
VPQRQILHDESNSTFTNNAGKVNCLRPVPGCYPEDKFRMAVRGAKLAWFFAGSNRICPDEKFKLPAKTHASPDTGGNSPYQRAVSIHFQPLPRHHGDLFMNFLSTRQFRFHLDKINKERTLLLTSADKSADNGNITYCFSLA